MCTLLALQLALSLLSSFFPSRHGFAAHFMAPLGKETYCSFHHQVFLLSSFKPDLSAFFSSSFVSCPLIIFFFFGSLKCSTRYREHDFILSIFCFQIEENGTILLLGILLIASYSMLSESRLLVSLSQK